MPVERSSRLGIVRFVLSAVEVRVLEFEGRSWSASGWKERAIREELGMSPVRYGQILNGLLDRPEAAAAAPVVVRFLRECRERRRVARGDG
jgi:hypothetical protein